MSTRGTLAAFAVASLFMFPTFADSGIVEKWHTATGVNYLLVSSAVDLDGNGTLELITIEVSGGARIGIRAAATGGLLAQTAATYQAEEFWIANVDALNAAEILVSDPSTGMLSCLRYTAGQSTLAVVWSYQPTPNGVPSKWEFVDFDGNGTLYLVFKDESSLSKKYYVRNPNGVLVTTLDLTTAPSGSGWNSDLLVDDYDVDGRMELMIDYHNATHPAQDFLYVIENDSPAPELAIAPGPNEVTSVRQRFHFAPNKVEQVQAGPLVRGNPELDWRAARRAVRLP
jgi:hypothetical protein